MIHRAAELADSASLRRTLAAAVILVTSAGLAQPPPPDPVNNVADYAADCYNELGLTNAQKTKLAPAAGFHCVTNGTLLETQRTEGFNAKKGTGGKTTTYDKTNAADFPATCDFPSWLSNRCYGHTYVQRLDKTVALGNPDVAAVLLCRHKLDWLTAANDNFDDIAIIMHNFKNGKTCWFQAGGIGGPKDGAAVTAPTLDTGPINDRFWLKPSGTANVHCIGCHDNGPFIHSIWINRLDVVPPDGQGKYLTPGAAFAGWATAASAFVAGKALKPKTGNSSCTSCHRISKRLYGDISIPNRCVTDFGNSRECGTWGRWMDYVTGGGPPDFANLPSATSDFGKHWQNARWMPSRAEEDHSRAYPQTRDYTKERFKEVYAGHLAALKACAADQAACTARADGTVVPSGGTTRATMVAALSSGGIISRTADTSTAFAFGVVSAHVGDTVTFTWSAENVSWCNADVTLPLGVYAGTVETGANWGGAAGSQEIGPLSAPGEYVFEINCDGAFATSGEYTAVAKLTAQASVRIDPDHFQCYKASASSYSGAIGVQLDDQLGPSTVDVRKPKELCNPADKNDEWPAAPAHLEHLTAYLIKQTTPKLEKQTLQVLNQFGTIDLKVTRAYQVLAPAAKSLVAPPGPLAAPAVGYFKCYKVSGPVVGITGVKVRDQFGTFHVDLQKASMLCLAATKNGVPPPDPTANLLCYKAKLSVGEPNFSAPAVPVHTHDDFNAATLAVRGIRELCVPSVVP